MPPPPLPSPPQPPDLSINIGIIGAGIAGLGAGIALSHAGHHVTIYERSRFSNEVGAAIHVCPNASRVLQSWGFDFGRARALVNERARFVKGDTVETVFGYSATDVEERYGAPWYFLHRVDLHEELRRVATGGSNPVGIELGREVVGVEFESGVVRFRDGSVVEKDLVVAADGVHSCLTSTVTGTGDVAEPTGMSAFRFLIPTEKLVEDPETRAWFEDQPVGFCAATLSDRRIIWYPCRGGLMQNFAGIHPDSTDGNDAEDWHATGSKERLLTTYADMAPVFRSMIAKADDIKLWKLLYRPPIKTWYRGRLVLIGDAAHPMLPHQGQGGGQAIEDCGALGVLLSGLKDIDELPLRLQIYQEKRIPRAAALQVFSNAGQDEAEKIEAEARKYVKGPIPRTPPEFQQWNFSYNVFDDCQRALEDSSRGASSGPDTIASLG